MSADLLALLGQLDEARAKATPGEWHVATSGGIDAGDYDTVIGRGDVDCMAYCYGGTSTLEGDNLPADAALIVAAVNAAPKLTAALRAVLELTEQWRYKGEFGWGPWQEGYGPDLEGQVLDDAAAELRAAITAALTPEPVQS